MAVDYCMNPQLEKVTSWGRLRLYEISFKSAKPIPIFPDLRRKLRGAGSSYARFVTLALSMAAHCYDRELTKTFLNQRNSELRVVESL
jgi:hypothetical protein